MSLRTNFIVSALVGLMVLSAPIGAATNKQVDDINQRIFRLEEMILGQNPVVSLNADKIRFGGFLTSTYAHLESKNKSVESFSTNRFEMLIGVDVTDNLEFFTAWGIISEAVLVNGATAERTFSNNRTHKVPLIISHGTYKWNRYANLKFGRFIAPVGIINVEHFPPGLFLETVPQFLRPAPGGVFWSHFLNGVDLYGSVQLGSGQLKYDLTYAQYSFSSVNDVTKGDSDKSIVGGRVSYSFWDDHLTMGTSWQHGRRGTDASLTVPRGRYDNHGFDLLIEYGDFNMKNEYVFSNQEDTFGAKDKKGYLLQPSYAITEKIRLVYRYDYYDTDTNLVTDNSITEQTFGINYLPVAQLRTRLEYTRIDYDEKTDVNGVDPDYSQFLVSAIVSF